MTTPDEDILLSDILHEIKKKPFGEVQFSVKVHQGQVANMVSTFFRVEHYEDNAKAVAEVLSMIKNMIAREQSGDITFTVHLNKGNVREITTQFTSKKQYRGIEK